MRAAVYRGPDDVRVESVPVPKLEPGDLLVRVAVCGVCGTDLKKISLGLVPPPRIFGHEIAGIVAAVTAGEAEFRPGDRVVVQHHVPCRSCFYCARRLYAQCPGYRRTGTSAGFDPAGGGFAEYVRVLPFARPGVVRIPDGVPDEVACWLEPLNTVLKGVRTLPLRAGDTVLVSGLGPIGLLFLQLLGGAPTDAATAHLTLLAADPLPHRREAAARLGGIPLDPGTSSPAREACALTGGRGADAAVVAVPSDAAVYAALEAVRPGGVVLLFAHTYPGATTPVDLGDLCVREKRLMGAYSSDIELQEECARLLFTGAVDVASLVTHAFPLEEIGTALATAANPEAGGLKVLVRP